MVDALTFQAPRQPAHRSAQLLQQIADTLGVKTDAFREGTRRHLFYTAEDGAQWFVLSEADGLLVVRQVGAAVEHLGSVDEPVVRFLAQHHQTPQGQALEALVNRLLLTCLR
ncbi:hypothetical protein [Methylobacterium aerolatum]|uniref:Uncharacterized protein n=1 Tax=Methylobacterium aerolatum TaxID=418708 RepID=A0ABU0HY80_9HYPH|nr:hypothetical protein [Methylobacterium aerolatum]MDQ0447276.1 hypothetical protein [Methylobacterium aerolatum]